MFAEDKKNKNHLVESDAELANKFSEAGMGFRTGAVHVFHPLEAAYLVKEGKSAFSKTTLDKFVASQAKKDGGFAFAFAVYCLIRKTGRLVRPYINTTDFFRVYAPGVGREEGRPSQLVCLLPGAFPSEKSIEEKVKIAHLARLDLIIANGDEKKIQFHKISSFNF